MAVAALQDHQRLCGKLLHGQISTLPAGVGPVEHGLSGAGRGQHLVPQAGKVHIGTRRLFPAGHTVGGRQVEIVGVQDDAVRKLLCQCGGHRGLAAAAAAVQCQHHRRSGVGQKQLQTVDDVGVNRVLCHENNSFALKNEIYSIIAQPTPKGQTSVQ